MIVYVYSKNVEDMSAYEQIIKDILSVKEADILSYSENKRSFRYLEEIKKKIQEDDIVIIGSLASLGLNEIAVAEQLQWFIAHKYLLVICSYEATYIFGVSQPMNQAVLTTILQTISPQRNPLEIPRKKRGNSGRNRISFPDNWDELYEKWSNKEITSKDFMEQTNMKKATFYNLITEYRMLCERNEEYVERFGDVR